MTIGDAVMNMDGLIAELRDDPTGVGYAAMTADAVAASMNAATHTRTKNRRVNERDVLGEFPTPAAGEAFLEKMEAAGEVNPVVKRALRWMTPSQDGIDAGHPGTIGMIQALVAAEVITTDEATAFLGMAQEQVSRATILGLGTVAAGHVLEARRLGEL